MSSGASLGRSRVSPEQLDLLLSFMEEHPELAAGKQAVFSRFSVSKLWRLLAERLNAAAAASGGARKSPDKWCRYWADIKYKARRKSAAGGALGELSSHEERLRDLLRNIGDHPRIADDEDGASSGSERGADDLLVEAALRSALAAEKQAEAVTQAVDLLRELVALVRQDRAPMPTAELTHHRI